MDGVAWRVRYNARAGVAVEGFTAEPAARARALALWPDGAFHPVGHVCTWLTIEEWSGGVWVERVVWLT